MLRKLCSGKLRVKVEKKEGYLLVDEIKGDVQLAGAFHEVCTMRKDELEEEFFFF